MVLDERDGCEIIIIFGVLDVMEYFMLEVCGCNFVGIVFIFYGLEEECNCDVLFDVIRLVGFNVEVDVVNERYD